jgi:uncharacterized membrane protein YraQ (UPF0718 family)
MLTTFVSILLDYLREVTEVVLVGFVIAGVINAVVNKEAIVRYLGHNLFVSNLLGGCTAVGGARSRCISHRRPTGSQAGCRITFRYQGEPS